MADSKKGERTKKKNFKPSMEANSANPSESNLNKALQLMRRRKQKGYSSRGLKNIPPPPSHLFLHVTKTSSTVMTWTNSHVDVSSFLLLTPLDTSLVPMLVLIFLTDKVDSLFASVKAEDIMRVSQTSLTNFGKIWRELPIR